MVELTGWSRTNRSRLRAILPPPDFELRAGPVWLAGTIDRWLTEHPYYRDKGS